MSLKNLITSAVLATALTGCFGPSEDTIIHIKEDVNAYSTNVQYQNEGMPFFDYIRLNYTKAMVIPILLQVLSLSLNVGIGQTIVVCFTVQRNLKIYR